MARQKMCRYAIFHNLRRVRFKSCHPKIRLYEYSTTRAGQTAVNFLNGYENYLVCDGYDGYNKLSNVKRCGCWAHARRKFYESIPDDENLKKTSMANEGFERINKMFAIEKELRKLKPEDKQKERQKQLKPVIDDFYSWLETLTPIKGSGLSSAVQYALNEKKYLYTFLENPNIPMTNNLAERTVKPFVIGRKNRLFSTSPKGANASAMAYSIINTVYENGLDIKETLIKIFNGEAHIIF